MGSMTPERQAEILEALKNMSDAFDVELAHIEADKLIQEFLPDEIAEAYRNVPKWYA